MKKVLSFLLICSMLLVCISVCAEDTKEALQKKLLEEQGLTFLGNVPNDATSGWRLSEYTSKNGPETFALDYYHAYIEEGDVLHALINKNLGITVRVSASTLFGVVSITIFKYHQDEEKDAKVLFDGNPIEKYEVDMESGLIEKIE